MDKNFLSVEDVLADESFQSWYSRRTEQEVTAWEQWIATRPDQQPLVNEAIQFMSQFKLSEKTVSPSQVESAMGKLNKTMTGAAGKTLIIPMHKPRNRWWMAAASIVLLGITLFGLLRFLDHGKASFATNYGQVSTYSLPDGTEVMLNANSQVKLGTKWEDGAGDREIWLNGEAFFHVKKTSARDRFIVHTNELD